ncbi:hypothetical protein FHR83_006662 [Actinoplanes campanulatus]|uniref:Uncharacterized protein n=1 Tax=Actinoplanes campanulatus TaxID=113559 RepID=A0A7W5AMD8_9ACTN|nr:hypothetical protein [Actinoplanes campanulatus]MBB3098956.1 hypothetical protein [Actinoplanes campanulatus]GGN39694.1 hypothetical protein GCM10010109_67940 [Actinoplanes campanulatus]
MTHHFRTLTAVVRIDDDSDLRHTAYALKVAREALTNAGFSVDGMRNTPNDTGELPAHREEIPW